MIYSKNYNKDKKRLLFKWFKKLIQIQTKSIFKLQKKYL